MESNNRESREEWGAALYLLIVFLVSVFLVITLLILRAVEAYRKETTKTTNVITTEDTIKVIKSSETYDTIGIGYSNGKSFPILKQKDTIK